MSGPLDNDFTDLSSAWADDWLARSAELVEKYHPDLVYFEWWIGQASIRPNLARFAAFYYNSALQYGDHVGVINYKDYAMQEHSAVLDLERGQLSEIRSMPWQTDTSVSNKSWGYITNDTFKSPELVVYQLVDIVSKNGNLLLNIRPRSDGTIPEELQQVLLDVGAWMRGRRKPPRDAFMTLTQRTTRQRTFVSPPRVMCSTSLDSAGRKRRSDDSLACINGRQCFSAVCRLVGE